MANYFTFTTDNIASEVMTFTDGSPTLTLVDIVNDISRSPADVNDRVVDPNKIPNRWLDYPGAYVYEFKYLIDPESIMKWNVKSLQVEIFAEHPDAALATNETWVDSTREGGDREIYRQASTHDTNATQENIAANTDALMSFDLPVYKDNNFIGINTQVTYDGNFVSGRSADGRLSLGQRTIDYTPAPQVTKVYFAQPYVTDDNKEMAEAQPIDVPVTDVSAGDPLAQQSDNDRPIPSFVGAIAIEIANLIDVTQITNATKPERLSDQDVLKNEISQGDLIAMNTIVTRSSLKELRDRISKERANTVPTPEQAAVAEALINTVAGNNDNNVTAMGHIGELVSKYHTLQHDVEIPKYLIDANLPVTGDPDTFYVRVTPRIGAVRDAPRVTPVVFSVDHANQLAVMLRPMFPPELKLVKNTPSHVIVAARTIDPVAIAAQVCFMIQSSSPESSTTPPKWHFASGDQPFGSLLLPQPSSWYNFDIHPEASDIPHVAPNIMQIRANTVGSNRGGEHSAVGDFEQITITSPDVPSSRLPIPHVSISAVNLPDAIHITVSNIPHNVIAIKLMREEIDESGDLSKRSKVVYKDGNATVDTLDSNEITYHDSGTVFASDMSDAAAEAVANRRYRYFCVMTVRLSQSPVVYQQLSATDSIVARIRVVKSPPVTTEISAPVTSVTAQGISVSINLTATPKPEGVNLLLETLRNEDVSQPFVNAIRKQVDDPGGFQDLVIFIGTRIDMFTGEHEYLGLVTPGLFVDNRATQTRNNRPPLYSGREYHYVFKLATRPPQSFLKNIEQNLPSKFEPGVATYAVQAQKFLSAWGARFGALPSTDDLNNLTVEDQFLLGETGITLARAVSTPVLPAQITNVTATYLGTGFERAEIKWGLSGHQNQRNLVDHFLVFVSYQGRPGVIGRVDCAPNSSNFVHIDTEFAPEIGVKEYYVVAVLLPRYENSAPSKKVKLTREHTIPPAFLVPRMDFRILGMLDYKQGNDRSVKKTPLIFNKNALGPSPGIAPRQVGLKNNIKLVPPPPPAQSKTFAKPSGPKKLR